MVLSREPGLPHPMWDDLVALRVETLNHLIVIVCLVGLGVLFPGILEAEWVDWRTVVIAAVLFSSAGLARWILARSCTVALVLLSLGTGFGTGFAALTFGRPATLFALPLFVFAAALFTDRRGAILLALGADALVWVVAHVMAVPVNGVDLILLYVFTTVSGAVAWFFYRPVEVVLDWAWASWVREQDQTAVARARQAELAQVSKSLLDACERLEDANATLLGARRAADEARRIKDEFATMVSHELRTPLNLVIGFSEMAAREITNKSGDVSPYFRAAIEAIHHNALHLSALADDVLDLGRLDAHRLALQKEWVNLEMIVREAAGAVDGLYASAGLQLTVDVATDLPVLYVDPVRVRQVLVNLLVNAVRYTEVGGIVVAARRSDHDVLLSVTDSGVGISPEDLPFVFSGYRQLGQTNRRGGFGLGLTISKRFVEMHAGSMWVTSTPAQGATFFFTLPIVDNVVALASSPSLRFVDCAYSEPAEQAVLVLARDAPATRFFKRYLDSYRVIGALTPGEVLKATKTATFDAIIVADDLGIDDPLVAAACRRLPAASLIRCGLRTDGFVGQSQGASAFLTKPIRHDDLRDTLCRLGLHPRHVLVVDDSPEMTRLLREMLQEILPRCQVREVHDGRVALALTMPAPRSRAVSRVDLVLLDLLLPGLDGRDLLATWRSDPHWRDVPVIIVSAAVDDHEHRVVGDFLELRRDGGLSIGELMAATRGILDSRAASRATNAIAWSDVSEPPVN